LQLTFGIDTLQAGLKLTTGSLALAGANLTLGGNLAYAGNWTETSGTLALGGKLLTLSGNASFDGGIVNGGGTLAVTAAGEISSLQVNGSVVLDNSGSITQNAGWFLGAAAGDTAMLNNAAGATFDIASDTAISSNSAGTSLVNAGTFEKTGGSGLASINVATINSGTVDVGSGGMSFLKPVSGTGSFMVEAGSTLTFGAAVAAGSAVTLASGAELFVSAAGGFAGSIAGFAASNVMELTGLAFTGATLAFNAATDKLTATNGATSVGLQLVGSYSSADFRLASDNGIAAILHT